MYKKSGTEESFLYDDKKGLEFSVLRDNEFLEKIKIKSEKLEEDYKTTINISEQNNEENEFFLSVRAIRYAQVFPAALPDPVPPRP